MAYYTIDVETTDKDFDSEGNIRAEIILDWFQNAAGKHSTALHAGADDLLKEDLMWVLTKLKVEFEAKIQPNKKYKCTTFHVRQKNVTFKRDYYVTDADAPMVAVDGSDLLVPDKNKALVKGASQWCLMHYSSRKLAKSDYVFPTSGGDDMIAGTFPKIKGKNPEYISNRTVSDDDIDFNNHCNNTKYIAFAEIASGKYCSSELFINYASETRLGDEIKLYVESTEEETYVEGKSSDDKLVFQTIYK